MIIQRWEHQNLKMRFLGWIQGFASILDGLVIVLSFGCFGSGFELAIASYRAKYYLKKTRIAQ